MPATKFHKGATTATALTCDCDGFFRHVFLCPTPRFRTVCRCTAARDVYDDIRKGHRATWGESDCSLAITHARRIPSRRTRPQTTKYTP